MSVSVEENKEIETIDATQLLKPIDEKNRLLILCTLARGEMPLERIDDGLLIGKAALSLHLTHLCKADLIRVRTVHQATYYHLNTSVTPRVMEFLLYTRGLNSDTPPLTNKKGEH